MSKLKTVVFSFAPLILLYLVSETLLSTINTRPFDPLPASRPSIRREIVSPWGDLRSVREQFFLGVTTLFESDFRAFLPPVEKQPALARIAFVGDSFVFGVGVEEYQTLPRLVSSYLEYYRPERRVETVNLGIPGGNTQTYVRVVEMAARYEPDLIFVGFTTGNDAEIFTEDNDGALASEPRVPRAETGLWKHAESFRQLRDGLVAHSRTLTALYRPLRRLESRRRQDLYMRSTFDDPGKWAVVEANLRAIAASCRQRGVRAVLLIYPYMFATPDIGLNDVASYRYADYQDRVRRAAEAAGLLVVDSLNYFREDGVPSLDPYLVPGDGHPNEAFNALVARHLARALADGAWLRTARPVVDSPQPGVAPVSPVADVLASSGCATGHRDHHDAR